MLLSKGKQASALELMERQVMNEQTAFANKFADDIEAVISCHDRVIFRGHLFQGNNAHLNAYVDYLGLRRKDFIPLMEQFTHQLVEHAKQLAEQAGAPYEPPRAKYAKEKFVDAIDRQRQHPQGLLAVLCAMENCRAIKLQYAEGKPRLKFSRRLQRVLYFYFNDPDFDRIYLRIETWFPFTVQVYVNGHNWLAQQMVRRRMGFVQDDNAFIQVDQPVKVQKLANQFVNIDWVARLDKWIAPLMPVLKHQYLRTKRYYWTIEQCEYSTDLIFRSQERLAALFPLLLRHALTCFSAKDILTFLGRRYHERFDGEVITSYKDRRHPGARIKHAMKANWIKMYDKLSKMIRIETVINQPSEFRILRHGTKKGEKVLDWFPMAKRATNLWRYTEIASKANAHYLDALATIDDITKALQTMENVCKPAGQGRKRRRALKPIHADDQALFRAVMQGEHIAYGFRNKHIAFQMYPLPTNDPKLRKKRSSAVTRRLQMLRVHGLIRKAPRATKYHITQKGFLVMGSAISLRDHFIPNMIERLRCLANAS